MIEVTVSIDSENNWVDIDNVDWTTSEEDGFSIDSDEDVERQLTELLGESASGSSVPEQLMLVVSYLVENFYLISSRVIVLEDDIETRRIENVVIKTTPVVVPEPEPEPPVTRVSRFNREPVI
jgi:hypothetical protein